MSTWLVGFPAWPVKLVAIIVGTWAAVALYAPPDPNATTWRWHDREVPRYRRFMERYVAWTQSTPMWKQRLMAGAFDAVFLLAIAYATTIPNPKIQENDDVRGLLTSSGHPHAEFRPGGTVAMTRCEVGQLSKSGRAYVWADSSAAGFLCVPEDGRQRRILLQSGAQDGFPAESSIRIESSIDLG